MNNEDISRISDQIVSRGYRDSAGNHLENDIWYMELKDIIIRQKDKEKALKEVVMLLNSMVLSGERHTEQSQVIVGLALKSVPSNEEIWEKATELLAKDYLEQAQGKENPEEFEALIKKFAAVYSTKAIVELKRESEEASR